MVNNGSCGYEVGVNWMKNEAAVGARKKGERVGVEGGKGFNKSWMYVAAYSLSTY